MKHNICNFVGLLTVATLVCGAFPSYAAQSPNPRGSGISASARTSSSTDSRTTGRALSRTTVSRNAVPAVSGRVSARGALTSRAMLDFTNAGHMASRSAVARSATMARGANTNAARSATALVGGASRASLSRATAVFSDISKIGGGYANCRDAYATCMDQFCAQANDTYRRCFCSQRFTEFRDTESALDQAKTLLMQFEDNNLNAVDKTAAEVNAMYSATVGEAAIKNDTSGAAKILDEIGDLLSGKKKATNTSNSGSLGIMSLDISSDVDDIWGDGGTSSIFGDNSAKNLAELEGVALYNASNKQCLTMIGDACESDAVLQMARSSYNIMITQDCNAYEKKIDKQKEAVKQTVRTAEKYLRDARLEEYRSHNSADVNECIAKVKSAILADTACGANYKRCMDYTGAYVNQTTGEPIYSPRLFQLNSVITLAGVDSNADVLRQNPQFDKFLDSKRMYAASALDTCRDIADTVWTEFKRGALIEIAQAQDEKIEEVKMSCVSTMAECYDAQSSQLKDFDTTTAKSSGAIAAYASREMCADKVIACASLYGDTDGCKFDGNGKLTSGNNGNRCGLDALLAFVDTVDTTRVAEACDTIVDNYLNELCTPTSGDIGYPYNCRTLDFGTENDYNNENTKTIWGMVGHQVNTYCKNPNASDKGIGDINPDIKSKVELALRNIKSDMYVILSDLCENTYDGIWAEQRGAEEAQTVAHGESLPFVENFYKTVFGGNKPIMSGDKYTSAGSGWGFCIQNTVELQCQAQDAATGSKGYAKYDAKTGKCVFTSEWYQNRCNFIGGYWENGTCYLNEKAN